jgi:hypothetical protein
MSARFCQAVFPALVIVACNAPITFDAPPRNDGGNSSEDAGQQLGKGGASGEGGSRPNDGGSRSDDGGSR